MWQQFSNNVQASSLVHGSEQRRACRDVSTLPYRPHTRFAVLLSVRVQCNYARRCVREPRPRANLSHAGAKATTTTTFGQKETLHWHGISKITYPTSLIMRYEATTARNAASVSDA